MSATSPGHDAGSAAERIVPGSPVWDTSYPDHIQRYRFALDYVPRGALVLDAGCGVGYGAAEVADARSARVVAVDIAADALTRARHHFDRELITWCQDDCQTLEIARTFAPFDVVINFENIEHLERPADFVARAAALLKPGGLLLTSTPNRLLLNRLRGAPEDAVSTNPFHLNELSEAELRSLLSRHFGRVEIRYQCPAGASRLRMALRSAAARLGILAPLIAAKRMIRERTGARRAGETVSPGHVTPVWTIEQRDRGTAWTLIAVCSNPLSQD